MFNSACQKESLDCSLKTLNRKLTAAEVLNLKSALEFLSADEQIKNVTDFDISGQELGDSEVAALVQAMLHDNINVLYLEQNKLTVHFQKTLESLENRSFPKFRHLVMEDNGLGTGTSEELSLLAKSLKRLALNNPCLHIDVKKNNFSDEIASELREIKDDDGASRIHVENVLTKPDQPANRSLASDKSSGDPVNGTSRKDNSIWESWRQALETAVGDMVVVISSKTGRTFCCGPIRSKKNRADLVELLQGSLENPSDDDEITLDFVDENGGTARLTRTMANIPSIAEVFIKTACIIQD
jgi:hypothetical protein